MTDNPFGALLPRPGEFEEAKRTLQLLAYQVGVKCGRCGAVLRGDEIYAVGFMAPLGTRDYQATPFCDSCSEELSGGT